MKDRKRKTSKRSKSLDKTFKLATTVAALGMSLGANVDAIFAQDQIGPDVEPNIEIDQIKIRQLKWIIPFVDIDESAQEVVKTSVLNTLKEPVIAVITYYDKKGEPVDQQQAEVGSNQVSTFDMFEDGWASVVVNIKHPTTQKDISESVVVSAQVRGDSNLVCIGQILGVVQEKPTF